MARLTTYRVTIEQTAISTVDLRARDEDDAEERAVELYEDTPGLFSVKLPKKWSQDFNPYQVTGIEKAGGPS